MLAVPGFNCALAWNRDPPGLTEAMEPAEVCSSRGSWHRCWHRCSGPPPKSLGVSPANRRLWGKDPAFLQPLPHIGQNQSLSNVAAPGILAVPGEDGCLFHTGGSRPRETLIGQSTWQEAWSVMVMWRNDLNTYRQGIGVLTTHLCVRADMQVAHAVYLWCVCV